jgi:hypothetical protein
VGAERTEADGRRAVDAAQRPVHVLPAVALGRRQ